MKGKRWEAAALVLVLAAALYVYRGAVKGFFVQDDFGWLESTRFQSLSEYAESFFRFNPALSYRPVSQEGYFWIGQKVFGMEPLGYHLASVFFHILGSVLLYLLLRQFFGAWPSLAGTLFYSVHGAHFRSVYWISAIPEPMALSFYVLGFLLFIRFDRTGRRGWLVASFLAMALGMVSKESILSLPLALGAYCLIFSRRRIFWTAPHFALSGAYALARMTSQVVRAAPYPLTFGKDAFSNLMTYFSWSAGMTDTMLRVKLEWWWPYLYTAVGLTFASILALLFWLARDRKPALLAVAWFAVALQPVLYFRAHIDPYYLAPSLAAVAFLIAASLPARLLHARLAWCHGAAIAAFILWASFVSVKLEGQWWNERTQITPNILRQMSAIDRQVPDGSIALLFGFGEEELGAMQNDSAIKAYGYSILKFIIFGIGWDTPQQIRALEANGSIVNFFGFMFARGEIINVTKAFHRNPGAFMDPPALDIQPREAQRGRDKLTLRLRGLQLPAIDLMYNINREPMPMFRALALEGDATTTIPLDPEMRSGLYQFRGIRDPRDTDPTAWYPLDIWVQIY